MAKYIWNPVEEMDLDDGSHTCYATETEKNFIWLTQITDNTWDVEVKQKEDMPANTYTTVANCKTLASAKRWVSRYW